MPITHLVPIKSADDLNFTRLKLKLSTDEFKNTATNYRCVIGKLLLSSLPGFFVKSHPALKRFLLCKDGTCLIMVTKCHSKSIRGHQNIVVFPLSSVEFCKHLPNLLLRRVSLPVIDCFYFLGRIFGNANLVLHGRRNCNALRPAEFKHALHVFPKNGASMAKVLGRYLSISSFTRE